MIPLSFLHQLEDSISRAAHEINEKHMGLAEVKARLAHIVGIDDLKVTETDRGDEVYTLGDKVVTVPDTNRQNMNFLEQKLSNPFEVREKPKMSPIDRIKAKALQARGIAPQAIKDFESDLDGIIGERDVLAQKRAAAVAPHKEVIAGIYGEFDGLKAAMDLLSNGGPPLEESETVDPASNTEVAK